jgi:hypothetical protein
MHRCGARAALRSARWQPGVAGHVAITIQPNELLWRNVHRHSHSFLEPLLADERELTGKTRHGKKRAAGIDFYRNEMACAKMLNLQRGGFVKCMNSLLAAAAAIGMAWLAPSAAMAQSETVTFSGSGDFYQGPSYTVSGAFGFNPVTDNAIEYVGYAVGGSFTLNDDVFSSLIYTGAGTQSSLDGTDAAGNVVLVYFANVLGTAVDPLSVVKYYDAGSYSAAYNDYSPVGEATPSGSPVPEPSSLAIAGAGLAALVALRRKYG